MPKQVIGHREGSCLKSACTVRLGKCCDWVKGFYKGNYLQMVRKLEQRPVRRLLEWLGWNDGGLEESGGNGDEDKWTVSGYYPERRIMWL